MQRFWSKVNKTEGCWLWTAVADKKGYGQFRLNGGMRLAHRVAFEMLKGPIADGLTLDHKCRNTGCVNPSHLEPVTGAVNTARAFAARPPQQKCKVGHDLSNSYVDKRGSRHCRECNNVASAAYRRRVGRCSGLGQGFRSDLFGATTGQYAPTVET